MKKNKIWVRWDDKLGKTRIAECYGMPEEIEETWSWVKKKLR